MQEMFRAAAAAEKCCAMQKWAALKTGEVKGQFRTQGEDFYKRGNPQEYTIIPRLLIFMFSTYVC